MPARLLLVLGCTLLTLACGGGGDRRAAGPPPGEAPSPAVTPGSTPVPTGTSQPAPTGSPPAPGDLDPTFGEGGVALLDFPSGSDELRVLALDDRGAILVAGSSGNDDARVCALARLRSDGSLDATFGGNGRLEVQPAESLVECAVERCASACEAVAPRENGSVLAAAAIDTDGALPARRWAVVRVPAGDASDVPAVAIVEDDDLAASDLVAAALDGERLLLAGRVRRIAAERPFEPVVRRYLADGMRDRSFGMDGTTRFPQAAYDFQPEHVRVQPDGAILVSGHGTILSPYPVLGRLTPSGEHDASFGGRGLWVDEFPSLGYAGAPAVAGDGRIVITDGSYPPDPFLLVRFTEAGRLDPTFGVDGWVATGAAGIAEPPLVALDGAGRILVAWHDGSGTAYVERRLADGALDREFGEEGTATLSLASGHLAVRSVIAQPDGRILLGGGFAPSHDACGDCSLFAVVRLAG